MKVSGSLPKLDNSVLDFSIIVKSPSSGFEFTIQETGVTPIKNIITFSGYEGYVFDQSGHFCGGYQSGAPFDISVHYSRDTTGFSYYFNNTLVANNMSGMSGTSNTAGVPCQVEFDKHGESSLFVIATGSSNSS